MRKNLLEVSSTELQTARIKCVRNDCGGIVEVPVSKLGRAFKCPLCSEDFHTKPLAALRDTLEELGQLSKYFSVSFVIPDDNVK